MNKSVLVTGAAGFIGRHLVEHLSDQGYSVHGLDRSSAEPVSSCDSWHIADIMVSSELCSAIKDTKPDFIFHMAALIRGDSLEDMLNVNVIGTRQLLDALLKFSRETVVLIPGSAAEYGCVFDDELPITEQQTVRPVTAYALSKVAQSLIAQQYWLTHKLPIVRTRPFNVSGPGEPASLVCSAFARGIAEIEKIGSSGTLTVGNLQSERDFIDVRDLVRAYIWLMHNGQTGQVYNICSGQSIKIQRILDLLLGMTNCSISVKSEFEKSDHTDIPKIFGSHQKLYSQSGWDPEITIEQSLSDLLDYWRSKLKLS